MIWFILFTRVSVWKTWLSLVWSDVVEISSSIFYKNMWSNFTALWQLSEKNGLNWKEITKGYEIKDYFWRYIPVRIFQFKCRLERLHAVLVTVITRCCLNGLFLCKSMTKIKVFTFLCHSLCSFQLSVPEWATCIQHLQYVCQKWIYELQNLIKNGRRVKRNQTVYLIRVADEESLFVGENLHWDNNCVTWIHHCVTRFGPQDLKNTAVL